MPIEYSVATVGREPELEQLDAALDGSGERDGGRLRHGRGRARHRQDAPARRAARAAPRSAATSCSPARRRSSSATCRSASGSTRSTRTSPRRSSSSTSAGAPSSWTSSPRSSRRCGPAVAGVRGRSPTSATAPTARCAGCSSCSPREQPLVVVLDDLHWSDDASIELIAALLRREPDAPVLLALAFRPGQAPARLSAALGGAGVTPDRARAAQRGTRRPRCSASSSPGRRRRSTATVAATRSTSSSSARARGRPTGRDARRQRTSTARGRGSRARRRRGVARRGARVTAAGGARAARAAAVAGEPFEPDLAAAIAELSERRGPRALDELLAARPRPPDPVPRQFVFRHPLVRRAVYESTPAGWRLAAHARAAAALAARGAAAAERAHHVEQSAGQGDEEAIALLLEAGDAAAARAPAAAARWFEAALRLLPAAGRAPGGRARGARVVAALARRARSLPRDAAGGDRAAAAGRRLAQRVELTAQCAAVEHWLGRHDDAHRRLTRAWDELPDRSTAEAAVARDRARGGRALRARLRAGGRDGSPGARDRAGGRRPGADRVGRGGAVPRRDGRGRDRRGPRAPAGGAGRAIDRLSDAELAPRLEALYYLAWAETYLEHYDDAVAHVERGIAIARAFGEGRLLVPLHARQELPVRDAGPPERGDRALRGGARGGAALGEPARPLPGAVRARLDALLRRRPRRRDRGLRGERARRSAARRRHDSERRRRARLGARRRAGSRRATSSAATGCCSSSSARTERARCRSSAASTGRA